MRLFLAIPLDRDVVEELSKVQASVVRAMPKYFRKVNPDNFHLTLRFIGEVNEEAGAAISTRITALKPQPQRYAVKLSGLGCFPQEGAARIVWAGMQEVEGRISTLKSIVDNLLAEMGLEDEKKEKFSPHITLARAKSQLRRAELPAAGLGKILNEVKIQEIQQEIRAVSLMSSRLYANGPQYSRLTSWRIT